MSTLLDHVRRLVEAEQGLTEALEKSLPLLPHHNNHQSFSSQQAEPPLLPTPRNAEEVPTILAVARAYSLRTSAPPMWNPQLPVIGFATPNPLPHQLRGGALGAMQLKMAREEKNRRGQELADKRERERRKKKEEEETLEMKNTKEADVDDDMDVDKEDDITGKRKRDEDNNPSQQHATSAKKEMMEQQRKLMARQQHEQQASSSSKNNNNSTRRQQQQQSMEEYQKKKEAANMNLSDSSSSSSDDDDSGSE